MSTEPASSAAPVDAVVMPRACACTHSLSAFVASLIPQPWMQSPKHCPAVRCQCGKQYYSFAERKAFNSVPSA